MYTKFSKSNDLKKFKFVTVDIVHNIWGYDDFKLEYYDYFSSISHSRYMHKTGIAQLLYYWNY